MAFREGGEIGRTWTVYALIDPRDSVPFYIGATVDLPSRVLGHGSDPGSAAWRVVQGLKAEGLKPQVVDLGSFASKVEAWEYEHVLIREHQALLVNRQLYPANKLRLVA